MLVKLFKNKDNLPDTETLIDLYGNDVIRICMYYMKNKDDAEDAFQDIFVKIHKNRSSYKGKSDIKTWITKIAINTCKDILKSSWNKKVTYLENDLSDKLIYHDKANDYDHIYEVIKMLPDIYKDVILLKYYKDMKAKEIAKVLGISESAANSRILRAKAELKSIFLKKGIDIDG
ncbi:RNA polymerase sigma-70 factor, ECF subfamily [Alkalithermobacter thermoalcaliphilus JW-YL-7 = DSM 7308]|uniref:RNA polymerase sigma-70 factor, ECF subfamily n=1 Tax=Alkalithermobacter thermoalcaliphilus JW-YL-7 = DSM 7308 TaxID=1121328 RepID=A0A150FS55_CLOPD|nr:RNA polymerase, sigma-24 subunit, RpoE, ECF subfamily [[Clostridium] paradoxum JW-YL-7 = DSM 7308]SHK33307.1 RNA polymerase sigma-70 factor, ECF subfamily [[Clostridium] paradoxum JW-YL-7 = DSM 7308]